MPVGAPKAGEWWWCLSSEGEKIFALVEVEDGEGVWGRSGSSREAAKASYPSSWKLWWFLENYIIDSDPQVGRGTYYWKNSEVDEDGRIRCKVIGVNGQDVNYKYLNEVTNEVEGLICTSLVDHFLAEWTRIS